MSQPYKQPPSTTGSGQSPLHLGHRHGPRPNTTKSNPHEQLDQNAPLTLQEELFARMRDLPFVTPRPSEIAPVGARALWLTPPNAMRGRLQAAQGRYFMIGTEFVHLHPPYDGSLHMALPEALAKQAIDAGWAELHPLAHMFGSKAIVMVFGPRDEDELAIVWQLVLASHRHALMAFDS